MLIVTGPHGKKNTLIFPITSREPMAGVNAVPVPETEAKRAKLYLPAWVIIDEFNRDDLTKSFSLEDRQPMGQFSKKFMLKLATAIRAVALARKMKIVPRK
jgi:hypothetical protein